VVIDENNTAHMFAAEMGFHCSLGVWIDKSQVIHAINKDGNPLGVFEKVGVAVPTEAHNPVLSRAVDGLF
jgi:hypothetical protein